MYYYQVMEINAMTTAQKAVAAINAGLQADARVKQAAFGARLGSISAATHNHLTKQTGRCTQCGAYSGKYRVCYDCKIESEN